MGGFFFSYFNDSLFWVVSRLIGIIDVKQQITAWSVPTILCWGVAGMLIAVVNLVFGSDGSWLDPLIPMLGVGVVFWVMRKK